jgi:hypothetical protein
MHLERIRWKEQEGSPKHRLSEVYCSYLQNHNQVEEAYEHESGECGLRRYRVFLFKNHDYPPTGSGGAIVMPS